MGGGQCKCVTRLSAFLSEGVSFSKTEIHRGRALAFHTHHSASLPSQPRGDPSPITSPQSVSARCLSRMMLWTQLLECGSVAFTLWECCLVTSEAAARAGSSWQPRNSCCVSGVPYPNHMSIVGVCDVLAQRHRALLCSK